MKSTPSRALAVTAGVVIVALTGAAFWLSYAHLAEVALAHGMRGKEVRAWAWPATLDLFIVAGELLMLRAALLRRVDWWAIGLTVAGSIGSIALNVAGVGSRAELLDYIVAAVPPTAALLAFGALMRQIHQALAGHGQTGAEQTSPQPAAAVGLERVPAPVPDVPGVYPKAGVPVPAVPAAVPPGVRLLPITARPEPVREDPVPAPEVPVPEPVPADEVHVPEKQVHPALYNLFVGCDNDPEEPEEPDDEPVYPDPLIPQVQADFGDEVPGVRRLKEKYGIGQARAQRIRDQLSSQEVPS
ncbi:DUF2637 domain-containing protein [Streptomyces flavofungini]|uniref:DUF2637 domain-containing protein n=1 Tax=Streptomyces flavofungini TaxID=68200 RepID=UPI0025B1FDAD|nr:DUF2637 domain-containing protein [Streptomyces flavofungini]WJV47663.1 DUF2637 domain-containing protein [Streptomyces flavofungini]